MNLGDVVDFEALDETGAPVKLSDFRGKPVVLFFYPKADTPGCTVEACEFRDSFGDLQAAGVTVLGISRDKASAQKKFKEKFSLPYTLLADPEQTVCKQFDVIKAKTMYGKPVTGIERSTFVFDKDGKLIHEMRKVTPAGHAAEILALLKG
ncbi:peroxiredoxin [Terriglobus saanensis]|uniref:thioredoxin-dependent peroxiredoxin n=1 Tax=Terriglobus saanensis (strain ATCC BAA-1853 / DSM 23119 / SP1PR4) TaxID=401053 RepID=E8V8M5_TERSS|nr:peroxiredoxin [Terriglobus saanensis]ADV84062.1 alkyl hydroperoxide reductase/ Thiol specific antioxidant/ Mal allergen [Terriglobus saanensis SP1PR4]